MLGLRARTVVVGAPAAHGIETDLEPRIAPRRGQPPADAVLARHPGALKPEPADRFEQGAGKRLNDGVDFVFERVFRLTAWAVGPI